MMNLHRKLLALTVLSLSAIGLSSVAAEPVEKFDFGPQQTGRIRAEKDPLAVNAIRKNFRFAKEGFLTVAIAPYGPPIASYATDAKTVVGSDADYAQLIADELGLKLNIVPIAWADWPLGLTSGKYDAVISNVGVTEQRKQRFDFTTYRLGLHGFYVKTSSPIKEIKEPKDIAGLRVITGSGTIQEKIVLEWSKEDVAHGLKPVQIQYFDDDAAARIALLSGHADVHFDPNAPLAFEAARTGQIRLVGTVNAGWPLKADVAIATRKDSGLADALTIATNDLIKDGKYAQALARWGLQREAVSQSETNPPGLPTF
ncbi:amino acid ABC transporter substrate-binding protein, PAAT family [Paraburkholderia fungorum]|uniref:Amino acid ABC transporter substrate-binding protein, PAAT family n=2 Tax=Paraburkholderia fungorum TaxID=134537 RepID=A0A1H1JJP8_9BURK|nr:amino acid ABC transporter substrate-binding protein, PAAT family [Paraburkholderia fungorum]